MQGAKLPSRPLYFIHGTDEPQTMGLAASRGCIQMRPEDVVELGRMIMDYARLHQEDDWVVNVLQSRRSSEVELPEPVRLIIRH